MRECSPSGEHFFWGRIVVFNSLKKLFGGTDIEAPPTPAPTSVQASIPASAPEESRPPPAPSASAFLCREAVFDRNNRLAGRLFRLQQSSVQADASAELQGQFDQTLLDTLNASPDAWNTSLAFIPLSSASLELAAVDRLKTANLVLLVQLAEGADPD